MQLKMNEYQLPERISFNHEELKAGIIEKVSFYETLVYTDENIGEAKKDRANLNKLKTALNDERIRLEKEYMLPFNEFKAKINEIIGIIDRPISVIDKQVKGFEEQKKAEKLEAVKELWNSMEHPEALTFEKVFKDKFLNASTSFKVIKQYFLDAITRYEEDIKTLQNLPEFSFEAIEVYKTSLDLSKAISEGQRLAAIQKRKEEAERQKAEQERIAAEQARLKAEAEEQKQEEQLPGQVSFNDAESFDKCINPPAEESPALEWVAFRALMTTEDALALKEFFQSRGIEFEQVRVF